MPKGVYVHKVGDPNHKGSLGKHWKLSDESRKNISLARKGIIFSEEHRKNISLSKTGKKHTEEQKKLISLHNIGKNHGFKKGMITWNKGKHHSEEVKLKMRKNHKGMTGKHFSEEVKKKIGLGNLGEKNGCWQGGKSFEKYGKNWTEDLKESIRKRDNYTCQITGCNIQQSMMTGRIKKIPVHHIDYDKKNLDPKNLITLCISHHAATNAHREYWVDYFKELYVRISTE